MRVATSVAPLRQMPHGPSSPCCRPRTRELRVNREPWTVNR